MSTEKHGEEATPGEEVRGWFAGRLPDGWFTGPPEVLVDREEITVVGPLGDLDTAPDASPAAQAAAADGRARRFREEVRAGGPQTGPRARRTSPARTTLSPHFGEKAVTNRRTVATFCLAGPR